MSVMLSLRLNILNIACKRDTFIYKFQFLHFKLYCLG